MKPLVRIVLVLFAVVAITSTGFAAEEEKPVKKPKQAQAKEAKTKEAQAKQAERKKNRQTRKGPAIAALNLPKEIELSAEQKEQVATLRKEYAPKVQAIREKMAGVLTEEQIAAQKKAREEAKGQTRKEANQAVQQAVTLSAEQKQQQKQIRQELQALNKEIRAKVTALLTADQQAQLKAANQKKRSGSSSKTPKEPSET